MSRYVNYVGVADVVEDDDAESSEAKAPALTRAAQRRRTTKE